MSESRQGQRSKRGVELERWLAGEGGDEVAKTTLNAQTWVDIRAIATIDKFLVSKGCYVRKMSELLREVIRMATITAQLEGIPVVLDIEDAIGYLTARGYSMQQYQTSHRQRRSLELALRAQAYERRDIAPTFEDLPIDENSPGEIAMRRKIAELEEQKLKAESLQEAEERRREEAEKQRAAMKEALRKAKGGT